jgi:hypothetical protein
MLSLKAEYVDPQHIAQTNFDYPRHWRLDCKELAAGKTLAEKEAIRASKMKEESYKVAAYLVVCFMNLQHNDIIWVPYNFK